MSRNIDERVVEEFGEEWSKFDQSGVPKSELKKSFDEYFSIFPWEKISPDAEGFDLGCGSGRWAYYFADRVGILHCIDPAEQALLVARKNLELKTNCVFHNTDVDSMPFADNSMDFGYSLGVLHHIPNAELGITECVRKLKVGAPLHLYLYYAFDNKPIWFKFIWMQSNVLREIICRMPKNIKYFLCNSIALLIYLPLSRLSRLLEKFGTDVDNVPLAYYRNRSFYSLRTDALDRFGTRLEKRFTKHDIEGMMKRAGLENIVFSEGRPYWCVVGFKSYK